MNAIDYQAILNSLNLAKQILGFYANEENYEPKLGADALILSDRGHQARYAIDTIKKISEPDYGELEQNIKSKIKDEAMLEHQKVEIEKALKSMGSFIDEYKKKYDELLDSGMFFEKFPKLTGSWVADKEEFINIIITSK
jgi:hypothetical protein